MSSFYLKMAATANRLIDKFGQTVMIERTTGETIDPVTGVITAGVTEYFYPRGVFKPYAENLIDGTRILKTDIELVLDNTVKPEMTDKIEGVSIINIEEINPAGTPLIYKLQVRK